MERLLKELFQKVPAENQQRLNEIITLGRKVYTDNGFYEFLSTPLKEFENTTAYDMILEGNFDTVICALSADYEGLGP